jgi:hypothetical protein
MANGVKTGGRKKGTPNKATAKKAEQVAASGLTPLDFMLDVMRNAGHDFDIRLDAAKSAAPYVHPKLAAMELTGKDGSDLIPKTDPEAVARRVAFLLAQGLAAK